MTRFATQRAREFSFRQERIRSCFRTIKPIPLIFFFVLLSKKKDIWTRFFHGRRSYRSKKWRHKMFKTWQWNHSPLWVLNILWRHFYGLIRINLLVFYHIVRFSIGVLGILVVEEMIFFGQNCANYFGIKFSAALLFCNTADWAYHRHKEKSTIGHNST